MSVLNEAGTVSDLTRRPAFSRTFSGHSSVDNMISDRVLEASFAPSDLSSIAFVHSAGAAIFPFPARSRITSVSNSNEYGSGKELIRDLAICRAWDKGRSA